MKALCAWIGSIINEPVTSINEECLLKILNKCASPPSSSKSSTQRIQQFFKGVYRFPVQDIVHWDKLFGDNVECELVAFLIIVGGMQTHSANSFVSAALALDDDVQFAIYAIIQGPMTQIANESRLTREDLIQVLQMKDHETEQPEVHVTPEPTTPVKNPRDCDHEYGVSDGDEGMESFVTSTPVPRHMQAGKSQGNQIAPMPVVLKKSPPRPNTLTVSDNVPLMPPPSLPPPNRKHTLLNADKELPPPPMSPLTPLKTLVESPHWNIKQPVDGNALTSKMRLHEAEQRARTAELGLAQAEAEREDAEAVAEELRQQLSATVKRVQSAETEVARLRREAVQHRDQRDELVEAKAELVLQAERVKALEDRLGETQASVARVRELEDTTKELERQLTDRDTRIASLLQKLGEIKNREIVNIEMETLRLRLKDAEAKLAEELLDREALERDLRSQQTVVEQMQVDRRIAEKRSRSHNQQQHLGNMRALGAGEEPVTETSFDVSIPAITNALASARTNGENLGCVLNRELEAARSRIHQLEAELREANANVSNLESEVTHLRESLAKMTSDLDAMDTALVMSQEAQAAAQTARDHICNDLAILRGRLNFDVNSEGLLSPDVIAFSEALSGILTQRDVEIERVSAQLRSIVEVEKGHATVQTEANVDYSDAEIQTAAWKPREDPPKLSNEDEVNQLKEQLLRVSDSLDAATGEISHLREELASTQEKYRQESALSARAHHNCELNEREARRFHGMLERHRSATMAFVLGLERKGLIERGTSSSASFIEGDVTYQLKSVGSQLELNVGNMEDVLKENCRLKEEVNFLRQDVEKSRELRHKLRQLHEDSEYLETTMRQLLRKQNRPPEDARNRSERRRHSQLTRPVIDDAQDTEDDSVAYTDLSQVSSRLPFSSPSPSLRYDGDDDDSVSVLQRRCRRRDGLDPVTAPPPQPARPTAFEISPPATTSGRNRRQPDPPPPASLAHPQSVAGPQPDASAEASTSSIVTQTYPAAHGGNIRSHNAKSAHCQENSEDLFARLAELRRRNDLQPFHLRTNYPVETQLRSPNELFSMLQTVHKAGVEQQQQQCGTAIASDTSPPSTSKGENGESCSPAPAGRSLRPKGIQCISEVLLTGASGIVGAEHLDLTSTRARPTESLLLPRSGQNALRFSTTRHVSPPSASVKKPSLTFEVELSPQQKRRTAPLVQRKVLEERIRRPDGGVSRLTEEKAPKPSTSKADKGWATPAAIAASNTRRPLKEATSKVNRRI